MRIDLHLDTLWKMTKYGYFDLEQGAEYSEVSHRTLKGNVDGAVFALYLSQARLGEARRLLEEQVEFFRRQNFGEGFKAMLAMEGGGLIEGDVNAVDWFAAEGVVYFTLLHNFNNRLGGSATNRPEIGGLTRFGEKVVHRCEAMGVLVDVSHASDTTANDVLDMSKRPVIASHSGCRALFDHPRNLTDELIKRIAVSGGIVGVPFVKKFVGTRQGIAQHIKHVVELVGIEHVGVGSDVDGAVLVDGVEMSNWHDMLNEELSKLGYTAENIEAVMGGNFARLVGLT